MIGFKSIASQPAAPLARIFKFMVRLKRIELFVCAMSLHCSSIKLKTRKFAGLVLRYMVHRTSTVCQSLTIILYVIFSDWLIGGEY